jgi:hypothetical protein
MVLKTELKKQIFFDFFFRKYTPKFVLLKQAPNRVNEVEQNQ